MTNATFLSRADATELSKAQSLLNNGLFGAARELIQGIVQRNPQAFAPLFLLASATQSLGDLPETIRLLERCLELQPDDCRTLSVMAQALYFAGRSKEAVACCDYGLERYPDELNFRLGKATVLDQINKHAEAWECIEPLMNGHVVPASVAGVAGRVLFGLKRYDDAIRWSLQAINNATTTDSDKRTLYMHLARVYDKTKRFSDAFAACEAAHHTFASTFDTTQFEKYAADLMTVFSKDGLCMLARATNRSELPVFVIGMPRSGTSLIEQIIVSHPDAYGAGEIKDIVSIAKSVTTETNSIHTYPDALADMTPTIADNFANQYLSRLRELAGNNAQRVTNKMLEQYEHVGLIWMLLPGARIIHVRRDPLDTCLSCYTRHINPQRMPYATNLEHLGFVHQQHERLMDHWKATLDLPILTVQYEDVVANQEQMSRKIIDFLGLPWDDRCLRYYEADRTVMTLSYDQVNKPIYDSSIGRWKNYESHLGPLKKALGMVSP